MYLFVLTLNKYAYRHLGGRRENYSYKKNFLYACSKDTCILNLKEVIVIMKNIWKKIIATCCVAVMLMTLPGVNVLADELQDEDVIISVAEDPKALPEDLKARSQQSPF